MVRLKIRDQRGTPGTLLLQPVELIVSRVRVVENPVRVTVERGDVAGSLVREPSDRDAADPVGPLGILVLPGDVIARAGRQHFHLVLRREPLGNQAAVKLRAAQDFGTVTLNDEGELHETNVMTRVRSRTIRASQKSSSRSRCP